MTPLHGSVMGSTDPSEGFMLAPYEWTVKESNLMGLRKIPYKFKTQFDGSQDPIYQVMWHIWCQDSLTLVRHLDRCYYTGLLGHILKGSTTPNGIVYFYVSWTTRTTHPYTTSCITRTPAWLSVLVLQWMTLWKHIWDIMLTSKVTPTFLARYIHTQIYQAAS